MGLGMKRMCDVVVAVVAVVQGALYFFFSYLYLSVSPSVYVCG